MFNKQFILLLCVAFFCATTYACPDQHEGEPIPVTLGTTTEYSEKPKAPILIPLDCVYYSNPSTIVVNFHSSLGSVSVEIENQTTGEYSQTMVNAVAGPRSFPISGNAGFWTVTFTLSNGAVYYGDFVI